MDCSFFVTTFNFNDIFLCFVHGLGIPFDIFALGVLAFFIMIAAISRLDFDFSLGGAIALTWALILISGPAGGSVMLQYILGVLFAGLALRILISIIGIFRQ